jgi:hypothetical protein
VYATRRAPAYIYDKSIEGAGRSSGGGSIGAVHALRCAVSGGW